MELRMLHVLARVFSACTKIGKTRQNLEISVAIEKLEPRTYFDQAVLRLITAGRPGSTFSSRGVWQLASLAEVTEQQAPIASA